MSHFLPELIRRLSDVEIRTVFIAGCGGGFDFVHSTVLLPELYRLKKNVIIGSYSFGDPEDLHGEDAEVVFESNVDRGEPEGITVKRVSGRSQGDPHYAPEIHMCAFLDKEFPQTSPHWMYAYYARAFNVPTLRRLYEQIVQTHAVDCILLFDGGSDSLMRGDENGLGDPVEDAVSVAAVATLTNPRIRMRNLICLGMGADRFNDVSDASSLRSIAELTSVNGFLGMMPLIKGGEPLTRYKACIEYIYSKQKFNSVLTGCIIASAEGSYGRELPPNIAKTNRVAPGDVYIWPLMSVLWCFDVHAVYERSLIVRWIENEPTVSHMNQALERGRCQIKVLAVENIPRHEEMSLMLRHEHRLHR